MLSGVTANRRKNNRMMIFDDFRFFRQREGYITKNLKIMGALAVDYIGWIMRFGLSVIMSNIDNYVISDS